MSVGDENVVAFGDVFDGEMLGQHIGFLEPCVQEYGEAVAAKTKGGGSYNLISACVGGTTEM